VKKRFRDCESGATLIEFGIAIGLLCLIGYVASNATGLLAKDEAAIAYASKAYAVTDLQVTSKSAFALRLSGCRGHDVMFTLQGKNAKRENTVVIVCCDTEAFSESGVKECTTPMPQKP
jgi:Flp pilus assembly pilin Flp